MIEQKELSSMPLTGDESVELRRLANRVNQYVVTDNYRAYEEIQARFTELLQRWFTARNPHGTQ